MLVVTDGAAVLADPGERPLYHPPARQHLEGVRVALGHDLHGHLQCGSPAGQLAGVSGIGPDQLDPAAGTVQIPQQRPGAAAVLDRGGGDHHGQDQAHGVYCDVPLAALTFLALSRPRVAFGTVSAARTDWESITAAVGSAFRPAAALTSVRSCVVQPGQGPVVPPGREVPVDGLPGREVRGQVPPRAPGPVQVQDGLDDPAPRPDPRPSPPPRPIRRQMQRDDLPLRISQVTGIAPGPCSGPPRIPGTRGPPLVLDRHTSGSWARVRHLPGTTCDHPGQAAPEIQPAAPIYQTLTLNQAAVFAHHSG